MGSNAMAGTNTLIVDALASIQASMCSCPLSCIIPDDDGLDELIDDKLTNSWTMSKKLLLASECSGLDVGLRSMTYRHHFSNFLFFSFPTSFFSTTLCKFSIATEYLCINIANAVCLCSV